MDMRQKQLIALPVPHHRHPLGFGQQLVLLLQRDHDMPCHHTAVRGKGRRIVMLVGQLAGAQSRHHLP